MNLLSGTLGVIFTLQGHIETAFPLMLAAAGFDFCDGLSDFSMLIQKAGKSLILWQIW